VLEGELFVNMLGVTRNSGVLERMLDVLSSKVQSGSKMLAYDSECSSNLK